MRRLYLKIYLTIIVSLLMVVVVAGAIWRAGWERSPAGQAFELAGELAAALPAAGRQGRGDRGVEEAVAPAARVEELDHRDGGGERGGEADGPKLHCIGVRHTSNLG